MDFCDIDVTVLCCVGIYSSIRLTYDRLFGGEYKGINSMEDFVFATGCVITVALLGNVVANFVLELIELF